MSIEMEIELAKLGELPLYPPRRRFLDFLPTFLVSWIRNKYSWPQATPREQWAVSGLMLRVAYQTNKLNQLIEEIPKAFFKHETTDPVQDNTDDTDPFRYN